MKVQAIITLILLTAVLAGCGQTSMPDPVNSSLTNLDALSPRLITGFDLNWGIYNLEISLDGSYTNVVPNREASGEWGFHLNVVKFLEVDPCTDCLRLSNVHLTPEGDVSVDITIQHPWPSYNKYCTGFDVRGIIMFPASQFLPDPVYEQMAEIDPPHNGWEDRYSSHLNGDAELMNSDGWTSIFAPDTLAPWRYDLDSGQPIFDYYDGAFASGDYLGTINAFKRYYSNETRHMFEAGTTVTKTYIIRPPASGPILASYAIYAHWAPPIKIPVLNPVTDFGPDANSPMPYEFYITQDAPIDPDTPDGTEGFKINWHVKLWNDYFKTGWIGSVSQLVDVGSTSGDLVPHPNGQQDSYYHGDDGKSSFLTFPYVWIYDNYPDFLPAERPYIFGLEIFNPDTPGANTLLSIDYYLMNIAIEAPDGEW